MKIADNLDVLPRAVSFGSTCVHISSPDQLKEMQIGYSVDPQGNSLVTNEPGYWRENWIVIGYEDLCGDPVFIDEATEGYPVYTAMHGIGSWNPKLIADSLEGFASALNAISQVAPGRTCPNELKENPLSQHERDRILVFIRLKNPRADMEFWTLWLEDNDT